MNLTLYLLKLKIEDCRERLVYLLTFYNPTYPAVVKCSQKLDKLLVKYENILITNKKLAYKKAS